MFRFTSFMVLFSTSNYLIYKYLNNIVGINDKMLLEGDIPLMVYPILITFFTSSMFIYG